MQALRPLQRYVDFQGRSGRAEYWQFTIVCAAVGWFLRLIDGWAAGGYGATFGTLSLLFLLGTIVPQIAVAVRRLHDRGHSGKVAVAVICVTMVGMVLLTMGEQVRQRSGDTSLAFLGLGIIVIAFIPAIWLIVQFCKAGDDGSNAYGRPDNDPVGPAAMLEPITKAMAAATATRPRAVKIDDNLETIERLGKLREQGLITEEEFATQKQRLLDPGS